LHRTLAFVLLALAPLVAVLVDQASAQQPARSGTFFITSNGSGTGDVGGLAGADKMCQQLAKAIPGGGNRMWRAYLSTTGVGAVNARDRIGNGPWYNVKGVLIAQNAAELHSDKANINNDTALDETGRTINMEGAPNRHDILTGSTPEGRAYPAGADMTCANWTSSSDEGGAKARVGHHDYAQWNSTHDSRGCSQQGLVSTGGDGLFYCFALPTP
jgi:hypothetical protein